MLIYRKQKRKKVPQICSCGSGWLPATLLNDGSWCCSACYQERIKTVDGESKLRLYGTEALNVGHLLYSQCPHCKTCVEIQFTLYDSAPDAPVIEPQFDGPWDCPHCGYEYDEKDVEKFTRDFF